MWQYIGNGSGTNGVPMRDLTDEEWNAIPAWLREIALTKGFYRNVSVTVPDVVVTEPQAEPAPPADDTTQPPLDDTPKKGRKAAK